LRVWRLESADVMHERRLFGDFEVTDHAIALQWKLHNYQSSTEPIQALKLCFPSLDPNWVFSAS
jgi:hypothetical protein